MKVHSCQAVLSVTLRTTSLFGALILVVGCNSPSTAGDQAASPSSASVVHIGSLGTPGCAPGAVFHGSEVGFPETGLDSSKGSFWALVFDSIPPPAGKDVKIVWRMTGTGDFALRATDADGKVIPTLGQPQPHGLNGSNWNHPGYEVGTGFNFPHSGCWEIHVARSDVEGDLWLEVASPA